MDHKLIPGPLTFSNILLKFGMWIRTISEDDN